MDGPITVSAAALVVAKFVGESFGSHLIGGEAHHFYRKFLERWQESPIDPATGLPRNHDLQEASRDALREAAFVLVMELAGRLEPAKPWLPRIIEHVRAGQLFKVPLLDAGHNPQREWVETLRKAIGSERFELLHDKLLLSEDDVRQCLAGSDFCAAFGPKLAEATLKWARLAVHTGSEPTDFEALLRQGWDTGAGRGHRATLAQAYCLFFREHLKRRPAVFNILVADTLNEVLGKITALAAVAPTKVDFGDFERWVEPQLGALKDLLTGISAQLAAVARGQRELADKQGEILVVVTTLQTELARGNPTASAPLEELSAFISRFEQAFRELRRDLFGLPLIRPGVPPRPDRGGGELWMLQAKYRALDLVGRESDMAALWQWLAGPAHISVRLLIGGAGAGKTRLGFELIWRILLEQGDAWHAGLVSDADLRKFDDHRFWQDWRWDKPTLLVLDYARSVHGPLTQLLKALALKEADPNLPSLRLLLLERTASASADWVKQLLELDSSEGGRPVRALFDPQQAVPLTALDGATLRRSLFERTLQLVAEFRGHRALAVPPAGQDSELDRILAEESWGGPLYLSMAALVAHDLNNALAGLRCTRPDLAFALAEKELRRIGHFAPDHNSENQQHLLHHLAACATLERGLTGKQLLPAVSEEMAALQRAWPGGAGDLAEQLCKALPDDAGGVAHIQPDFIGEAVILEALRGRLPDHTSPDRAPAALSGWLDSMSRCAGRDPFTVPATLVHAFQNFGHLPDCGPGLLAAVDRLLQRGLLEREPQLLLALEAALPHQTVGLRIRAAKVTRALYERLKTQLLKGRADFRAEVARLANNLAVRLSDLGQRAEALAAAEEALELYRQLAAQNPDAFRPVLAASLNTLAIQLSEPGRRTEALAPALEAVEIRRELAAQNPNAFRPDLATSLNTLAIRLSESGRRTEALAPAQEAAELYRQLAAQNPDAFRADLATSLNTLSNRLSESGRLTEALALAQEAVDVDRQLAEQNPDAFRPALAGTLNTLAIRLSESGRRTEALAPALEAVEIRRQLAAQNPDAFQPDLASALNNLAIRLSESGRRAEALVSAQEAAELYRQLATQNPGALRPDLAMSLNTLSNRLSVSGRLAEALALAQEAVDVYRQLAAQNPEAFRPDLAMSLSNLAIRLSESGRRAEALAPAQEAVEIRRELAAQNPNAFRPDLATSLNTLANQLSDSGRLAEALASAQESVEIRRQLAGQNPDAFRPVLATSLNTLAIQLSESGRLAEALAPAQEAVDIYRQQAAQNPDAFRPDLATSLGAMGYVLAAIGRHGEAAAALAEGIRTLQPQFAQLPDAFAQLIGTLVRNYRKVAQAAQSELDMQLLAPVEEVLQQLQRRETNTQ